MASICERSMTSSVLKSVVVSRLSVVVPPSPIDRSVRVARSAKITGATRHHLRTVVTVLRFGIYLRRLWMLS
jgi:hypothetical protein